MFSWDVLKWIGLALIAFFAVALVFQFFHWGPGGNSPVLPDYMDF